MTAPTPPDAPSGPETLACILCDQPHPTVDLDEDQRCKSCLAAWFGAPLRPDRITIEELAELFGTTMPMAAMALIKREDGRPIEQVRAELRALATPAPSQDAAASEGPSLARRPSIATEVDYDDEQLVAEGANVEDVKLYLSNIGNDWARRAYEIIVEQEAALDACGGMNTWRWWSDKANKLAVSNREIRALLTAATEREREAKRDIEEYAADKRRLAREIDVAMHGEEDAAPQASLCDLVPAAKDLRRRAEQAVGLLLGGADG